MKTLLYDADPLVYALGHTVEITDVPLHLYFRGRVSSSLCNIMDLIDDEVKCRLYLTDGKENFRNEIAVTHPYKGNRPTKNKPVHYDLIREVMVEDFGAHVSYTEEADDRITILKMMDLENNISASVDKDFLGTPGKHLLLKKGNKGELVTITEEQARKFFWCQVLTGDKIDNIIGVRGIGPITANKILADCVTEEDYFMACVEQYDNLGMPLERVIENCQLLHLRRVENEIWTAPF